MINKELLFPWKENSCRSRKHNLLENAINRVVPLEFFIKTSCNFLCFSRARVLAWENYWTLLASFFPTFAMVSLSYSFVNHRLQWFYKRNMHFSWLISIASWRGVCNYLPWLQNNVSNWRFSSLLQKLSGTASFACLRKTIHISL